MKPTTRPFCVCCNAKIRPTRHKPRTNYKRACSIVKSCISLGPQRRLEQRRRTRTPVVHIRLSHRRHTLQLPLSKVLISDGARSCPTGSGVVRTVTVDSFSFFDCPVATTAKTCCTTETLPQLLYSLYLLFLSFHSGTIPSNEYMRPPTDHELI